MNLYNEDDRTRLFQAMRLSYLKLEPFRLLAAGLVEEYAGSAYGYEQVRPRYEILANLLNQAVDAYVMSLAANRPRGLVETQRPEWRFFAKHYGVAINNLLQEIQIEQVIRKWVLDAFFLLGVVKVHMADTTEVQLYDGVWIDPGTPMATNISLDNWCHDMSATRWDQVKFAADCYRIPFDDLRRGPFDQSVVDDLHPTNKMGFSGWGQRQEYLSKGYQTDADDVEPMIDVMDVWIPRERKIYTFAMDTGQLFQGKLGPLAELDWDGPELGPYHLLSFNDIPENIMPASPAAQVMGLSRLINNILRKQGRQARRQKELYTYTPAGAESAKRIQRSSDGDWVEVQDPKEVGVLKSGGVDAGNQAFVIHLIDVFDRMCGNLPAMLGLGPQADTLGQEQLIYGSVSKKDAQMRYKVMDATRGLIRNLAYMLWHDAVKVLPGRMSVPGAEGATIDATWAPEFRMGQFHDFDLDVDVFSMPYQPPERKAAAVGQLLATVYLPLAPVLMQQGGEINLQALTELFADYLNLPKLREIIQFSAPPPADLQGMQQGMPPAPPGMPETPTTRNYVRRNVATGGTPQARSLAQQQGWLSRANDTNANPGMSLGA
jgi:hypothetical protein